MTKRTFRKPCCYGTLKQAKPTLLIIKNKIIKNRGYLINTPKPALFKTDKKYLLKIINYIRNYLSYF